MPIKIKNKKIIVAMSGGVDSSVAAALLKRAAFEVSGVFMRLNDFSSQAEKRARKVAKFLKIPFYVFDFRKEFKKRIIDDFLKGYKKGTTPNPCVICNKEIKFGLLLEKSLALDADFVAAGHYARLRRAGQNFKLLRAKDKNKDQSYFLWRLNQKQLKRILFPVGDYTRKEVELMARKFRLPVLSAKKSVEICFIPNTINDFLKKYLKEKAGPIVEQVHYGVKKIIGQHRGLWFYTIGQRKGIKLSGGPYYVIAKDFKKNILIVSKNKKDLARKELVAKNINWIHPVKCRGAAISRDARLFNRVKAKIRYRHEAALATIYKMQSKKYKILFTKLQRAITPGQSVVFYKGKELLGGGIIDK
jgi:tRNA-specific 2-thiouridylase